MSDFEAIAQAAALVLAADPTRTTVEIDTPGFTSTDVLSLIDAIYTECGSAGVAVKGIKIDPTQLSLPPDAELVNAFRHKGRLVIVDLDVDDKVIVRRR